MNSSETSPRQLLEHLLAAGESEVVEFKEATKDFSTSELGKYFSALANEASLAEMEHAWLVFGVRDKDRAVVGTSYRPDPKRLDGLKHQIHHDTSPAATFRNIMEVDHPNGRVLIFAIPAAPTGQAVAWKGHYYGRAGDSLVALSIDKLDQLRRFSPIEDWSALTAPDATLDDLDPEALETARRNFAASVSIPLETIHQWSLDEFLTRLELLRNGELTHAALLLLGHPWARYKLRGGSAEITWTLPAEERAYAHFGPPFLLTTTKIWESIRTFQIHMLRPGTLLQTEVSKYDRSAVLEALHNAIAHADWSQGARITLLEFDDRLVLSNPGTFIEGRTVEDYVFDPRPPQRYRNRHLASVMHQLQLIDRVGYGLRKIHDSQRQRYLPLPDYDLTAPQRVTVTIYGQVLDEGYTSQLMAHTDLDMRDVLALDRVQKRLSIDKPTRDRLRRRKLISGRAPHLHVTAAVASATGTQAQYLHARATENAHLEHLLVTLIDTFGPVSRQQIDDAMETHLPSELSEKQRRTKVSNLLTKLRTRGTIANSGTRNHPAWVLAATRD